MAVGSRLAPVDAQGAWPDSARTGGLHVTGLRTLVMLVSFASATSALADLLVSQTAAYAYPAGVAANVKAECVLPAHQAEAVRQRLSAIGIPATAAESDEIPATGRFLSLRIEGALSGGNAFLGHGKQVTTTARLFQDGAEVAHFTATRSSMGGVGAGFKGSCSVLNRCANTLASDIGTWLSGEIDKIKPPEPESATAPNAEPATAN